MPKVTENEIVTKVCVEMITEEVMKIDRLERLVGIPKEKRLVPGLIKALKDGMCKYGT